MLSQRLILKPLRTASRPNQIQSQPLSHAGQPKNQVSLISSKNKLNITLSGQVMNHQFRLYHCYSITMNRTQQEPLAKEQSNYASDSAQEIIKEETLTHEQLLEQHASLKAVLAETTRALQETKEKLIHSYSERENIRRIAKRDVESATEFGIKSFVMKLFDVLDTVDICLNNLPKEIEILEKDPNLLAASNGIEATKKQFIKVMGKYGIDELKTSIGDKFDPNFHNAVFEVQPTDPSQMPNTVGAIIKGGWLRKGALLRPTHVGVVMKKFQE